MNKVFIETAALVTGEQQVVIAPLISARTHVIHALRNGALEFLRSLDHLGATAFQLLEHVHRKFVKGVDPEFFDDFGRNADFL